MMTSPSGKAKKSKLASGIPPWHASAFVGSLLAASVCNLPNNLDEVATVETFTRRVFPDLISLRTLAVIRLAIALSSWLVTLYMVFGKGWIIETTYRPNTKLRNTALPLSGITTLLPFTSWCWILQGMGFSLSGYIALMAHMGSEGELDQSILRSAIVLWEIAAPFALLVSAVVRYAIWPAVAARGRPHELGNFKNMMQHNMNSVYALTEMSLLGGLPIVFSHMSLPCLIGIIYILFSWGNSHSLAKPEDGPQYLYWFFDTTLGKSTTIALVALLLTLVLSFIIFFAIKTFIEWTGPMLSAHIITVVLVSSAVIRTKD